MRLPLQALPAFKLVAELQNLRAAATQLNVTHSAVSQQIRGLEEQLGFPLFERRAGRLVLNPAGDVLLRSVRAALERLDEGMRAAAEASSSREQRLRVTMVPSFAQRWLLPRMERWNDRHPAYPLEMDATRSVVDLARTGMHVAIRTGRGPWPGLEAERLFDDRMPYFAVGSPTTGRRLRGKPASALAEEPLLGDTETWREWFDAAGVPTVVKAVAEFNDAGLMLQAAELNLGVALVRGMFAADALREGRLVRLSREAFVCGSPSNTWFVHPPALRGWPPLEAFRQWLRDEIALSLRGQEETGG